MFPLGFNGSVCGNPIIIDDDILENDESFSVSISQFDPNIILGPIDNATIVIVDDDGKSTAQHTYMVHLRWSIFYIYALPLWSNTVVVVVFPQQSYSVSESDTSVEVCVDLQGIIERNASVSIQTSDGTATGAK